jgi:hypothetical protein
MSAGVRKGRVPQDGCIRGCGLELGNLTELCANDPEFQAAMTIAADKTLINQVRLMNLFLLIIHYLPKIGIGNIVEFGSYRGGSALFMAHLASKYLPQARVYGFDTFAGMPETDRDIDAHRSGDFNDTNVDSLRAYAKSIGLSNIEFIPGRFEDTAKDALEKIGKVTLAHIDCDIYSAVALTYDLCKPHMVDGGYIVFDDPTASSCLGALEAVEENVISRDQLHAEQIFPHFVFRYPPLKG